MRRVNEQQEHLALAGVDGGKPNDRAGSVDRNEQMYRNFVKRFGVSYPIARDPQEDLSYRYGTYKIPESYIIDRNGTVMRKYAGLPERDGQAISWMDPELVGFVKSLL